MPTVSIASVAPLALAKVELLVTVPPTLNVPPALLTTAPLTAPPLAMTVALLVRPPAMSPVVCSVPPVTVAPPLSWPSLNVVPAVLVSGPDTVPLAWLKKRWALFTAPVMV